VTIAGHLIRFSSSRWRRPCDLEFRYNGVSTLRRLPDRGVDGWLTLAADGVHDQIPGAYPGARLRVAGLYGALGPARCARHSFRTELKNWTTGASLTGVRGRYQVNDLPREPLANLPTPDYGCSRKKASTTGASGQASSGLDCRSDRRHPRLSRRGREDWCVSLRCGDRLARLAAVVAPATYDPSSLRARAGRRAQRGVRFFATSAPSWIFSLVAVLNRWLNGFTAIG